MRVVIVAESFLPRINGVSGSVIRASRHLLSQGHNVEIIAPSPSPRETPDGVRVHSVRSFTVPGMGIDVGYAWASTIRNLLRHVRPDVVHLASPLVLGYQALRAATMEHIPTVAVFQTDISGFARHYRLTGIGGLSDAVLRRIHAEAELEKVLPEAHFTGMLRGSDLGIAMASLDILVAPGERETFCQVLQEGMASGLPVVAPDIGGPRDLVVHGEVGLRYPPGDIEGLRVCVDALVQSPAARKVMGATARSAVRDRTWTQLGDELIQHYRCLTTADVPIRQSAA